MDTPSAYDLNCYTLFGLPNLGPLGVVIALGELHRSHPSVFPTLPYSDSDILSARISNQMSLYDWIRVVFMMHDASVDRTTDGSGELRALTSTQVSCTSSYT